MADVIDKYEPRQVTVTVDDAEFAETVKQLLEKAGYKFVGGATRLPADVRTMYFLK